MGIDERSGRPLGYSQANVAKSYVFLPLTVKSLKPSNLVLSSLSLIFLLFSRPFDNVSSISVFLFFFFFFFLFNSYFIYSKNTNLIQGGV